MNSLLKSLLLLSLFAVTGLAAPAAKPEPRPELLPIQDAPGLPRVLLIGDTVSIGYTLPVRKRLEGKANVHRVLRNCGPSQLGAESVAEWLGPEPWDVVHFNFGASDLMLGKDGEPVVTPERYAVNLRIIVNKIRAHSPRARLVFATTTPVPETLGNSQIHFAVKDADACAAAARKVMDDAGVRVNDLHALVMPRLKELQIPGNIHFRAPGWDLMGEQTAKEIAAALKDPPPAVAPVAKGEGLRVFTCGHSFHVWVVPLLSEMAFFAGITDHVVAGRSSIGGSTVMKHWDVPEEKNLAKQALRAGKVDVLTLSPIWLPEEGIEKFAALAFEHNKSVRVTVQEYWLPNDEYNPVYPLDTRKKVDHNATTIPALRKAQDQYDHDIDEHCRGINKKLGKKVIVTVPCGQAVLALREKIIAGEVPALKTQTELFRDNWGHPTVPVQVLAAYCHFAVIYRRTPLGLPLPTAFAKNPAWDEKLNRLLQELAWDAVTKHPLSGMQAKAGTK